MTAPAPSPLARVASLPSRLGISTPVAVAIGILVAGVALTPLVEGMVDWSMDGDLTPGVWEPRQWLAGTLISALLLSAFGVPLALLTLVVLAVVLARGGEQQSRACPSCDSVVDVETGHCPGCGALPPRRPRRGTFSGLVPAARIVAAIVLCLVPALFIATGISWIVLEREEDAFGERARAAERAGADTHEETNRHGSLLGWRRDRGYWSHRD